MAYYLPQDSQANDEHRPAAEAQAGGEITDLRIFWGPEICRLEYLLHLLDTGRIVDEQSARSA